MSIIRVQVAEQNALWNGQEFCCSTTKCKQIVACNYLKMVQQLLACTVLCRLD